MSVLSVLLYLTRLSDRQSSVGWDLNVAMQQYGDKWREHRRIIHQQFHIGSLAKYHTVLSEESRKLLRRLLQAPERFIEHTKQFVPLLRTGFRMLILGPLFKSCSIRHIQSYLRV